MNFDAAIHAVPLCARFAYPANLRFSHAGQKIGGLEGLMKIFACCAVGCVLIFLAMGYQAGLFDELSGGSSSSTSAAPPKEPAKNKGPRATYPDALAEACRGKGAPTAAEYLKIPGPHR